MYLIALCLPYWDGKGFDITEGIFIQFFSNDKTKIFRARGGNRNMFWQVGLPSAGASESAAGEASSVAGAAAAIIKC